MYIFKTKSVKFFQEWLPPAVPINSPRFLPCLHLLLCISILQVILDPSPFFLSFLLSSLLPHVLSRTFFFILHHWPGEEIVMAEFPRVESGGRGWGAWAALQAKIGFATSNLWQHWCQLGDPCGLFLQTALASLLVEWHLKGELLNPS